MSSGGEFIWRTNITDVARQTEQALGRITRATRGMGGTEAQMGAGIDQGIQARVRGIETQLRNNLRRIGSEFDNEMRAAAARGERFTGRVRGQTFQQRSAKELADAERALTRLGGEAGRGIPAHMTGLRQEVEGSLRDVGRSLASIYRQDVNAVRGDLQRVRQETGVKFAHGQGLGRGTDTERLAGATERRAASMVIPSAAQDVLQAQRDLGAVLAQSGVTSADVSRMQTQLRTAHDALANARAEEERVTREVRANRRPDGSLRDPGGAREMPSGRIRDAQGALFDRAQEGLVPAGTFRPLDEALANIKDNAADARAATQQQGQAQRELVDRQRQAQTNLRRSVDQRLERELALGQAVKAGSNIVRDATGRFYEYRKVAGEALPHLVTPRASGAQRSAQVQQDFDAQQAAQRQRALTDRQAAAQQNLRRSVDQRLSRELELGQAVRLNARTVQDAAGRFYRFNQVAGQSVPVLQTQRTTGPTQMARLEAQAQAQRLAAIEQERRAAASRQAQAAQMTAGAGGRGGGGGGGALDRFFQFAGGEGQGRGLRGADIMQNVMAYSRYFVSASLLMGTIAALRAAKDAAIDYRESLTDLEVAMGDNADVSNRFIAGLSDIARFAGEHTGAAIDSAVRGIRAFVPMSLEGTDEFQGQAERMGTEVALASQQLAVIAEKELKNATGDVISIGFAFNLNMQDEDGGITEGMESFGRIPDAIANAKRTLAGDASEIAQGLSSIGTAAAEAGFTLEETANLVSLVQARTDQSGRAVATRLGRIFSIIGGSAGRGAIEQLNMQLSPEMQVDTTGSVRDQLMGISRIYSDLSSQQQNLIRSALGGTANIRELIPILQSPDLLEDALRASFDNAGAGADEFQRKASDLAGVLRQLRGNIQNIVTALFEGGAGGVFLVMFKSIVPLLDAVRQLLNMYNRFADVLNNVSVAGIGLGDTLQALLVVTLQLKAASKVLAAAQGVNMLQGFAGRANNALRGRVGGGGGMAGPMAVAAGTATNFSGLDAQMANALNFSDMPKLQGALASIGHSVNNLWTSAKNFVLANPLLIVAAGILAIGRAWDASKRMMASTDEARDLLSFQMPRESSAKDLREMAQNMREEAESTRRDSRGFGWIADALNSFQGRRTADQLDARARAMFEHAMELEDRQREFAMGQEAWQAIRLDTDESVSESMKILQDSGRDATSRMEALGMAIAHAGEQAAATTRTLNDLEQFTFGFDAADQIRTGTGQAVRVESDLANASRIIRWTQGDNSNFEADALAPLEDFFADADLQQEMGNIIADWVQASGGDIDTEKLRDFLIDWMDGNVENFDQVDDDVLAWLEGSLDLDLNAVANGYQNMMDDARVAVAAAQEFVSVAQEAARELETELRLQGGGTGQGATLEAATMYREELEQTLANLEVRRADGEDIDPAAFEQLRREIQEAELSEIEAMQARIDRLAALRASEYTSDQTFQRAQIEVQRIRDQMAATDDVEALEELQAELNEAMRQEALEEVQRANAYENSKIDVRDTVARAHQNAANIYNELALMERQGDTDSAAYFQKQDEYAEALHAAAREDLDLAEARRDADRDPRDTIGAAVDAVTTARANVDNAKFGSIEYERAVAEWAAKTQELSDLRLRASQLERRANIDPRDTMRLATNAVQDALENLNNTIAGTPERSEAWIEYRQSLIDEATEARETAQARRAAATDPRDTMRQAANAVQDAREDLRDSYPDTQEYYRNREALRAAIQAEADLHRQYAAARRTADADPESQVEQARASLDNARAELRAAKRNTVEFENARREYQQEQLNYANALRDARSLSRQVSIDLTDPVATAREELQSAREALRAAIRRGAPQDVVDERTVAVQNAEAQAEAALFQQRLNDVQHANDMGRMSHIAYMSYLQSEHDRLQSIAQRTRQQTEQLQQIESLMKAAKDELEGQFNIGDIRMPTPFEVRRAIAAQAAGIDPAVAAHGQARQVGTTTTTTENTILVNGADTAEVTRILKQILGPQAMGRTTTATSGTRRL